MRVASGKHNKSVGKKGQKYVQSHLQIGPKNATLLKCAKCEMTYCPSAIEDTNTHKRYHDIHLRGKKWPSSWGIEVHGSLNRRSAMLTPPSSSSSKYEFRNFKNERIILIRPDAIPEVRAALEIMHLVNEELNAPHDENDFWSQPEGQGKAFLYIKDDRAVGVITIEILDAARGRWMIYDSKSIVEHIRPNFALGISRIWVCRTQRNKGIATKLIEAARENTIYGKEFKKWEIAWSQPTDSGGKLASAYNGMIHKSGKLLIPCYI